MAEEDQEALFEVAEMLQVSDLIKALNRTGRLDDEDAKVEEIQEDVGSGDQKLSGKAKLVDKARQERDEKEGLAREAKKAPEDDSELPEAKTKEKEMPEKKRVKNGLLEEIGKLEKALVEEAEAEAEETANDKSESGEDGRNSDEAQKEEVTSELPSTDGDDAVVGNRKTNRVSEGRDPIEIVLKDQEACKGLTAKKTDEETVDKDGEESTEKEREEEENKTTEENGRCQDKIPGVVEPDTTVGILDKDKADESEELSDGEESNNVDDEQGYASSMFTVEMDNCHENEASVEDSDKDKELEKTKDTHDVSLATEPGPLTLERQRDELTISDQAILEVIPSEKQSICSPKLQERKLGTKSENERNKYEEIPIKRGAQVREKSGTEVLTDGADKIESEFSENDTKSPKSPVNGSAEKQLKECSLKDNKASQESEKEKVFENIPTADDADEISQEPETVFFADCGPTKPTIVAEEFSFAIKEESNEERDSADERDKILEGEHQIESESDQGSNRENLQCRDREEEMMRPDQLLLQDTTTKTDEGSEESLRIEKTESLPHLDGTRDQMREKRKHEDESSDQNAKKSKTTKLHCKCMPPSSGESIRCMFCSER